MYIPVSYWQNQGITQPHMRGMYFLNATTLNYNYNSVPYSYTTLGGNRLNPTCLDVSTNASLEKGSNLYLGGAAFFCTAAISGTIDINTPPKTGPEAWYIDVTYPRGDVNVGTVYYNYIDQTGTIINDTLVYNQTKRIVSQTNPLCDKHEIVVFDHFLKWTIIEKFPGQVIPYAYFNVPSIYTFQLKRDDPTTPGSYVMPQFLSTALGTKDGFTFNTNSGSFKGNQFVSASATTQISSSFPPIDHGSSNTRLVPCVWITNVTPIAKGALNLTSCVSSHSLWVTLNNYDYYNTGSVLKVTNSELTSTSSCWTVSNLTSSLSTSVAFTDVNISQSYVSCSTCLST
jgi:hypothetical protein